MTLSDDEINRLLGTSRSDKDESIRLGILKAKQDYANSIEMTKNFRFLFLKSVYMAIDENGWSQRDVASVLGTTRQRVSQMMKEHDAMITRAQRLNQSQTP